MSSIGTGYDLTAATFSTDGRIFQVEYAQKAVDSLGTVIAMTGKDGVVVAIDKLVPSKMALPNSNPRVSSPDKSIGLAIAGLYTDGRALHNYAVDVSMTFLKDYRYPIGINQLADRISDYMHYFTLGLSRPFGCSIFLSAWNESQGPQLHVIETSGLSYQYRAWAAGKNRQAAKTEIEKLKSMNEMTMDELVNEAARIIMIVREENKEKDVQIEMGWIGAKTKGIHQIVPNAQVLAAEQWAKAKIDEAELDD